MVVRNIAAPPTPWSKNLAQPKIDETAYVHSFSNLIGDVRVGAKVLISPGTSIRADEGSPFFIGEGTNIQDGVVIHALDTGRVIGDDKNEYAVWIGKNACITHMALVHGPAYIGDNCFIGFRSTVFNARIGQGCIVMMHALIQDVEIPKGRYVPSGSVITNQQQADRLPNVQEADRQFASHVVEINEALRAEYVGADRVACLADVKKNEITNGNGNRTSVAVGDMSLNTDVEQQVRSLLASGYKISLEHADERRFKRSSWLSAGMVEAGRPAAALNEIQSSLADYEGEYVRLIGVDPQAKRRVSETVIQRPGESPSVAKTSSRSSGKKATSKSSSNGGTTSAKLDEDLADQVRSLLSQGLGISLEHADERRFKRSSWLSAGMVESSNASSAVREIESTLAEYDDEYVRLIGFDPNAKRRIVETVIQRPGEKKSARSNGKVEKSTSYYKSYDNGTSAEDITIGLDEDTVTQVRSLLAGGYKIGTEHADPRRFKTGSWQTCAPIESRDERQVIKELEACIANHEGEYVRMLGIDPNAKRRVLEMLIMRPNGQKKSKSKSKPSSSRGKGFAPQAKSSSKSSRNGAVHSDLDPEVIQQVRSLLAGGYKIGTEHAGPRRFKTGSWQTCPQIESKGEAAVLTELQACLAEHQGEYVRLIGIDPNAKRRVSETIIQRPLAGSRR